MSDFLDDLRQELDHAARRRARGGFVPSARWSRRTLVLAAALAIAAVAVPAAAVTGVFTSSPAPAPVANGTQPGLVGLGRPCSSQTRKLPLTSEPPPAAVRQVLAVFRRPQQPQDKLPAAVLQRLSGLPIQSVNPDSVRLAVKAKGLRIVLVPSDNVRYREALPNTKDCKRFKAPPIPPAPGVCLLERGGSGAGSCNTTEAIRRGLTMLTSGGSKHGTTHVAGIAPDGVRAVIWRVRRGHGFLDTRIPVHNNVYAANVPGRHGHGLYVFFETPAGRKLVRGPHRFTARELARKRLDKQRDETAGPTPTVFPRVGGPKSLFVLRVKVRRTGVVYVASWDGPPGTSCADQSDRAIGLVPAGRGALRGLIRTAFGPPLETGRWCPGRYTGTIRLKQRGRRVTAGPVVSRFSFEVRG